MTYPSRASDTYVVERPAAGYIVSMSFATRLRRAMDEAGVDQTSLARELGISRPAVGQWIAGSTHPSFDRLPGIAAALKVEVSSLLDETDLGLIPDPDLGKKAATVIQNGIVVPNPNPKPGDEIYDLDEVALLRMWRGLSMVKKAALFAHLGADDMPSLRKSV